MPYKGVSEISSHCIIATTVIRCTPYLPERSGPRHASWGDRWSTLSSSRASKRPINRVKLTQTRGKTTSTSSVGPFRRSAEELYRFVSIRSTRLDFIRKLLKTSPSGQLCHGTYGYQEPGGAAACQRDKVRVTPVLTLNATPILNGNTEPKLKPKP